MNFRYTFAFLRILKMPGLYPLMKDWQASIRMNFIFAAHESGLLKALNQPCDRQALIEKLEIKRPELFDALLEVGLAAKELAKENNRFYLKGKRSKAIAGDNGDMLSAVIQAGVTYYSDAYRKAAARMQGESLGNGLNDIGEIVARFSKMTEPIIKDFLATQVRNQSSMTVLDVGCGSGILLRCIYENNGNADGIGLDIDKAVVDQARKNIAAWGLADRFTVHCRNACAFSEKKGCFNLVSAINVLYYFNENERRELMSHLRSLLAPNGKLIIAMNFHSGGKDIGAANLNVVNNSLNGFFPFQRLTRSKPCLLNAVFLRSKPTSSCREVHFQGWLRSIHRLENEGGSPEISACLGVGFIILS